MGAHGGIGTRKTVGRGGSGFYKGIWGGTGGSSVLSGGFFQVHGSAKTRTKIKNENLPEAPQKRNQPQKTRFLGPKSFLNEPKKKHPMGGGNHRVKKKKNGRKRGGGGTRKFPAKAGVYRFARGEASWCGNKFRVLANHFSRPPPFLKNWSGGNAVGELPVFKKKTGSFSVEAVSGKNRGNGTKARIRLGEWWGGSGSESFLAEATPQGGIWYNVHGLPGSGSTAPGVGAPKGGDGSHREKLDFAGLCRGGTHAGGALIRGKNPRGGSGTRWQLKRDFGAVFGKKKGTSATWARNPSSKRRGKAADGPTGKKAFGYGKKKKKKTKKTGSYGRANQFAGLGEREKKKNEGFYGL